MPRRSTVDIVEALFGLYEQKMYRIAYAILHDEGQAEDAVMAAFEKVIKRRGIPRDPESDEAKRLMLTAIRSAAIDQYRANARERERAVLVDQLDDDALPASHAHADPIGEHVEQAHARELVENLPEPYGDVLRERFLNDRTTRQTAERLGISEANVRKRQERAIRILREKEGGHLHECAFNSE